MFNIDNAVPETPYVAKPSQTLKPGIVKIRPIDFRIQTADSGKKQIYIIAETEPIEGLEITFTHKGTINPGGLPKSAFAEIKVGIYMDLALQENQIKVANAMHAISVMTDTLEETKGIGGATIEEFLTNIVNITSKGKFGYATLKAEEYAINDKGYPKYSLGFGGFKDAISVVPAKDFISLTQTPVLHTLEYKKDAETKTLIWDKSKSWCYKPLAEETPTSDILMDDTEDVPLNF